MADGQDMEICGRIAKVRLEVAGARGKASFAKRLGLSASTYNYYESSRVPPADVLVRIADLAGVDLRWLLTGQAAEAPAVPANHPVVLRAAKLMADRPKAAQPLAAFLDVLAASLAFPPKAAAATPQAPAPRAEAQAPPASAAEVEAEPPAGRGAGHSSWIPVLGRSAAGVPRFWGNDEAVGLTTLNDLIARHAGRAHRAHEAQARGETTDDFAVQFITLTAPSDEVAEFIAAPGIRACHPDAFAVRIDGDSMAPDIRHGDLAILSPSVPAADGRPAVVQLAGQIGATCKIYRREGDAMHLIPLNEQFAPQSYPAAKIEWAFRVLAKVRP